MCSEHLSYVLFICQPCLKSQNSSANLEIKCLRRNKRHKWVINQLAGLSYKVNVNNIDSFVEEIMFVHSKISDFWRKICCLSIVWDIFEVSETLDETNVRLTGEKSEKESPFALILISLLCWRNNIDLIWFAFLLSNICLCFSLVLFSLSRTDFCVHKDEPCDTVGESSWTALFLVDSSHSYFMGIYNHTHKYLKNKIEYLLQSVKNHTIVL